MGILKVLKELTGEPSQVRRHRDEVRMDAKRQAKEALQVAGSSAILREIEIADAQYRTRLRGKGRGI